jgi:hypothetical protein
MRLAGFVFLLVVVFVVAHLAGAGLGPVTTSHSQVQYTGSGSSSPGMGGMNMGGMNMGGNP